MKKQDHQVFWSASEQTNKMIYQFLDRFRNRNGKLHVAHGQLEHEKQLLSHPFFEGLKIFL